MTTCNPASADVMANLATDRKNSRQMPESAEHAVEGINLDDVRAAVSNLIVDFVLARNNDGRAVCSQIHDLCHPARDGAAPTQKNEKVALG